MKRTITALVLVSLFVSSASFSGVEAKTKSQPLPASDPDNKDGWVLREDVSDEFEGSKIDESKWLVQGRGGNYYIWKGRAPSQFAPHNVIVEGGKLKLRTQWEPDFEFAKESYADGSNNDTYGVFEGKPLPVTTAAVVSQKRFLNGYMEIKSKSGDAAITAAFWGIGHQQELDVFEQMGNPKINGSIKENSSKMTVHDWSPPAVRPTRVFSYKDYLPGKTSEKFHIYGAEWGKDYLKVYRDGKMLYETHQKDIGTDWVLNNPMEIWLDSEIFKWLGLPHKEELPVDFEVEYVRVWQKPTDNLLAEHAAFFGFEGPMLFQDKARPWKMLPEDTKDNVYQQFWQIDEESAKNFRIVENRWVNGVKSLKHVTLSEKKDIKALSPKGGIDLAPGNYELSFTIWLNHGDQPKNIRMSLKSPDVEIPRFDTTEMPRDKWITVSRKFTKTTASSPQDQLEIKILGDEVPAGASDFYMDNIEIKAVK